MGDLTIPRAIAQHRTQGASPTLIFLPGYASDMTGSKALALEAWAAARGQAFIRFDYRGCGASEGTFADFTLEDWRDDALAMIDSSQGPVVLIGSSMGGWIMLLAALARPDRVVGLVGIAAAPDFTTWGFTAEQLAELDRNGVIAEYSPYGPEPTLTYRRFIEAGNRNLLLDRELAIDCPVRLLHGQRDTAVPWSHSPKLAAALRSDDVQVVLVKDGDHRLSREQDIQLLIRTVEALLESA